MFKIEKIEGRYKVSSRGNRLLGYFEPSDDGFYYWWAEDKLGSWPAHSLRELADKLDEINKFWNDEIDDYFDSHFHPGLSDEGGTL